MNDMKKTILVTGGAGFIGVKLSNRLLERGYRVVVVDNLLRQVHPSGKRPDELSPDAELIVKDVRDEDFWTEFLSQNTIDTLVHLAAETGTGQSLTESSRHGSVNVVGLCAILDGFSRNSTKPRGVVLSSSRAVYGEGAWCGEDGVTFYPAQRSANQLSNGEWSIKSGAGITARPLPHRAEAIFPAPVSIYGATKLAQEHIINAWCNANSVKSTVLRLQNVYGPGQAPGNPYTGIMVLFHQQAKEGKVINVYEDGHIGRDFVYIDDVISAFVSSIEIGVSSDHAIDVGFGDATTVLNAAQHIASIYGAPDPVVTGAFRNGDVRWAVSDVSSMKSVLDIAPTVDFTEGNKRLREWLFPA